MAYTPQVAGPWYSLSTLRCTGRGDGSRCYEQGSTVVSSFPPTTQPLEVRSRKAEVGACSHRVRFRGLCFDGLSSNGPSEWLISMKTRYHSEAKKAISYGKRAKATFTANTLIKIIVCCVRQVTQFVWSVPHNTRGTSFSFSKVLNVSNQFFQFSEPMGMLSGPQTLRKGNLGDVFLGAKLALPGNLEFWGDNWLQLQFPSTRISLQMVYDCCHSIITI